MEILEEPETLVGEEEHGNVLLFQQDAGKSIRNDAVLEYKGKGMQENYIISANSKFVFEVDVCFGPGTIIPSFALELERNNSNKFAGIFSTDRAGKTFSANGIKISVVENKWYALRAEVDLASKTASVYVDGAPLSDGTKTSENFSISGMQDVIKNEGVTKLRLKVKAQNDKSSFQFYVDNLRIAGLLEAPRAVGLSYTKDGTTASAGSDVPVDAASITVGFNNAIVASALKEMPPTLVWVDGDVERPMPVQAPALEEGTSVNQYTMTLNGTLRENATYRVDIPAGLTDENGFVTEAQTLTFSTVKPACYLETVTFGGTLASMSEGGTAELVFANTGEEAQVVLVAALYKGGEMLRVFCQPETIAAGGAAKTFLIPALGDTSGCTLRVYAWSDLVDFAPFPVSGELQ